jgi:hypothetical protein
MKDKDLSRRAARGDRLIREHVHDPYKTRLKLTEPTVCPQCGAVYHEGRWHWAERPDPAQEALCQACRRSNDGYPAGILTLSGTFLGEHRTEVLGLARHQEELEKGEHPLHRIMSIDEQGKVIVINTTDIHLPRRIGAALYSAYEGELDFHYNEESYLILVGWKRDE